MTPRRRQRQLISLEPAVERDSDAEDAIWRDSFGSGNVNDHGNLQLLPWASENPFDDHGNGNFSWQETIRGTRNFVAGILWLMVVRGVLVQCLRTRRHHRSDRTVNTTTS